MKHSYDVGTRTHCWTFGIRIDDVEFIVPLPEDSAEYQSTSTDAWMVAREAMILGFKQKIANGAAIPCDVKTGKSATDAEKRDAMQAIVDRLDSGEWNAVRTGATKSKPIDVEALVSAIMALRQRPEDKVRAFVAAKTEEQRFALAMNDEFRLEYAMQCVKMRPAATLDDDTQAELDAI